MSQSVAVVMAAGKGTRMKSDLPKVLLEVCGRPMVEYVLDALAAGGVERFIVVVGHRAELVRDALAGRTGITFVEQAEQLGTGHAVMVCRDELAGHDGAVLVVAGDSPLLESNSVAALLAQFAKTRPACILGTGYREDPTGFGRIFRDENGQFVGVIEEKDAGEQQRQINEVNLSCYVFNCRDLFWALQRIDIHNAQKEFYITDCPGTLKTAGRDVRALDVMKPSETLSINTAQELAEVETVMQERLKNHV